MNGTSCQKSEIVIVPKKPGNAGGGKDYRVLDFDIRGTQLMLRNGEIVSTKLMRIAEIASQDKRIRFTSLAHMLTPELLKDSFNKLNQKAAPGVDGETVEAFGADLNANIDALWLELRTDKYRASDVRRTYIPKTDGKLRPLGIPTVKDRVVQRAVNEILSAIYEPYFENLSYGFRKGRSTHDALEALRCNIDKERTRVIVDADIKSYFDMVNHKWLMKFLEDRIADRRLLRLIGKWLKAGIMDGGLSVRNEDGVPQGGPLSPLLANIYLHYVLDLWFEKKFKPTCRGKAALVRYADDFVVTFELRIEAERFVAELRDRFALFSLELSEEKTRMVAFGRKAQTDTGPGPAPVDRTFVFLGFTHYMRKRSNRGYYTARKPSKKSRNKFLDSVTEWIRRHRDWSVQYQAKKLKQKLQGYYNYFGLRHCLPSLSHVKWHVGRIWIRELRKRSQRHKLFWHKIPQYAWFNMLPEPTRRNA